MHGKRTYGVLLVAVLCGAVAWAQELPAYRTNNIAAMLRHTEAAREQHAGNPDMLVLPGVTADRVARRVVIQAEATGISGNGVAEFFIIAPHSGNDYEALSISLATAEAIDHALRFIGMIPGRCVDYARYRFWPRGERVNVWFQTVGSNVVIQRAESLLLNEATGKPLRPEGLVYVQAPTTWVTNSATPDSHPVDADSRGSIAANYNEPFTLLDVPRAAPQSEVYKRQVVNPDYVFDAGQRLDIVMAPERPAGEPRVQDLDLIVRASADTTQSLARLQFSLTNRTAATVLSSVGMNELLRRFMDLCDADRDPFVTLRVDEHVQIGALKSLCLILASIETDHGIRMDPPAAGHLYYRAYIPDNGLRNRDERIMQPAELTITRGEDGALSVTLLEIMEHWRDDEMKPSLTFKTHPIGTPGELHSRLADMEEGLPILLVFVPPTLEHGELMRWMDPILMTHPTVHVFTPVSPSTP